MRVGHDKLLSRLTLKAATSDCKYRIAAAGIDHRGNIIAMATNRRRGFAAGAGIHAEQAVMYGSPRCLSRIVVVRVNRNGKLLPIHACEKCQRMARRFGVTIEGRW